MNASDSFIDSVKDQFGFTTEEANKILQVYKENKIVKFDKFTSNFTLISGAFWDKSVMINALNLK